MGHTLQHTHADEPLIIEACTPTDDETTVGRARVLISQLVDWSNRATELCNLAGVDHQDVRCLDAMRTIDEIKEAAERRTQG